MLKPVELVDFPLGIERTLSLVNGHLCQTDVEDFSIHAFHVMMCASALRRRRRRRSLSSVHDRWMSWLVAWWLRGKHQKASSLMQRRDIKGSKVERLGERACLGSPKGLLAFTCSPSSSPPPSATQQTSYQTWLIAVIWTLGSH